MFSMFHSRYGTFKEQTPEAQTPEVSGTLTPEVSSERRLMVFQGLVKSDDDHIFDWEPRISPWRLFAMTLGKVGRSIPAVLLLWSTMGYRKEQLMKCDIREHALASVCMCEYTKAFIRVFPLLAVSICLDMTMRLILQERIYYGFLRVGALLDFETVKPWKDLHLWLLVLFLMHGVCHFILKFFTSKAWHTIGWEDDIAEMQAICQVFLAPSFLFILVLVFLVPSFLSILLFVSAADIEAMRIPLNKYLEEDIDMAPQTVGCLTILEEKRLRSAVLRNDFIAEVQEPPTIKGVYEYIIQACGKLEEEEEEEVPIPALRNVWPAILLVDPRLKDVESSAFRRMFAVFHVLSVLVNSATTACLICQALKDLRWVFLQQAQTEDIIPFFVLSGHALLIGWLFTLCTHRGHLWRLWATPKC